MKVISLSLLLILAACGSTETVAPEGDVPQAEKSHGHEHGDEKPTAEASELPKDQYGVEFTLAKAEPVTGLLADPKPHVGKTVRVSGEVTTVCQKAGCWLVMRGDEGDTLRVTMKEHGFAVAKDIAGRTAHVEGEVIEHAVDPETVAHFKSETDADGDVPEEGKTHVYEIVASAVQVLPAQG